jgi:hypothetical protein
MNFLRLKGADREVGLALPSSVGVKNVYRCACLPPPDLIARCPFKGMGNFVIPCLLSLSTRSLVCTPSRPTSGMARDSAVLPALSKLAVVQLLSGGCLMSCSVSSRNRMAALATGSAVTE